MPAAGQCLKIARSASAAKATALCALWEPSVAAMISFSNLLLLLDGCSVVCEKEPLASMARPRLRRVVPNDASHYGADNKCRGLRMTPSGTRTRPRRGR